MLLSNSARKHIIPGIIFFISLTFLLFSPVISHSQQKPVTAFLETGPSLIKGMPGIGMNALTGWKGVYQLPAVPSGDDAVRPKRVEGSPEAPPGSGEVERAAVYFTKTSLPVFESWSEVKTAANIIFKTGQKNLFIYRYLENWTLFIEFPGDDIPPGALSFADALIQQMILFSSPLTLL